MNGITILLWAAIFIIGAIAIVGVKLRFKDERLGTSEKSLLSKEENNSLFSFSRKKESNSSKPS